MHRVYEQNFVAQYPLVLAGQKRVSRGIHRQEFLPGVRCYMEQRVFSGSGGGPVNTAAQASKGQEREDQLKRAEVAMPIGGEGAASPGSTAVQ